MANFDTIKTAIDANIKTNGKQEITGGRMNSILHQMVDATGEQLTELESSINDLIIEPIVYQLTERNNRVLRGDVLGAVTVDGFATSDYIPVGNAKKIVYKNTYEVQPNNYFAGFVLYDNDSILYVGGESGEVNLENYPNAISFRFCAAKETELSLCKVEVIENKEFHSISRLTEDVAFIQDSLFQTQTYRFNTRNSYVLRGDVVGLSSVEGFSTSDFISIGNATIIKYSNTFAVQPNNYYAGFVMYNEDKDAIVFVGGGTGEVEIKRYPEAKYFRFCIANETEMSLCNVEVTRLNKNDNLTSVIEEVFINTLGEAGTYLTDNDHVYVGYDKVFRQSGLLSEYRISLYGASANDIGTEYEFFIGQIDQRNWLLPRVSFKKAVDGIEEGALIFKFDNDLISYKENEVIFIKATKTALGNDNNIVALHSGAMNVLYTYDLLNAVQFYGNGYEASIKVTIRNIDSYFAAKEDLNTIETNVNRVDSSLNRKQDSILVDEANGNKYKLVVNNGNLAVKLLKYAKVLFIGNSFTKHEKVAGLWECDGRSMAASTDRTMYASLVANHMSLEADRTGLVGFERNLTDFDFSNLPNKSDNYDAIVVQLGENIIETDTNIVASAFRNLFAAIKANWSNADLYMMFGTWRSQSPAISNVASEMNIPIINCGSVSLASPYQAKDYYIGDNGQYYEMADNVYRSHPSDIGMFEMAQKVVEAFGEGAISDKLFALTLNQTLGGTISTASDQWVEGGVVTIRCEADAGKSISGMSVIANGVSIVATKRVGTYVTYTFIMPKGNVAITPTWK